MRSSPISAEEIHPSLWRASQLARGYGRVVDEGYAALSAELPGGGWPQDGLIDLLVPAPGVGEMRLLQPALISMRARPIALVKAPHTANGLGWAHIGVSPARLLQLKTSTISDTLWCAEQIVRADCFGAVMVWLNHVQAASLRQLHLAAQTSQTLFVTVRPDATTRDASPATLRLSIAPASEGLAVDIVKRRGPGLAESLTIALHPTSVLFSRYEGLPRKRPRARVVEAVVEVAS